MPDGIYCGGQDQPSRRFPSVTYNIVINTMPVGTKGAVVFPVLPREKRAEVLTLKPSFWGMSVDLKELGRWIRRRLKKL